MEPIWCAGYVLASPIDMTKISSRLYHLLLSSRRLQYQGCDRVGLRHKGKVTCLYLDRFRAHALRHEALEIGIDRPVFRRHSVPSSRGGSSLSPRGGDAPAWRSPGAELVARHSNPAVW